MMLGNSQPPVPNPEPASDPEESVKKLLLIAALGSLLAACSVAETTHQADAGLMPRDPPYAKGNASNDTFHQAGQAPVTYAANSAPIPPRDPPYAKGDASNDTFHLPSGM